MQPTTLLLVLVLGPAPANGVAQASACRPLDAISARFVQLVTQLATRTDPLSIKQRALLKIPQVKASQIGYVTDSRLCGKAFATYNPHTEQSESSGATIQPSTQLYLVKAGPVYVATDPAKSNGHYMTLVTLDEDFEFLASGLK